MRGKTLAVGIAILVSANSLGCKSASKLAWWKSAEDAQAEAAVMAHSAPTLPSEIAKQAEIATTDVNITPNVSASTDVNTAAPFVPSTTPTPSASSISNLAPPAYPNTGASSFSSPVTSQNTNIAKTSSANLGTTAMPYDPQAVPASNTSNSSEQLAQNSSVDNRYGAQSVVQSSTPTASVYQSAGDRYAMPSTVANAPITGSQQIATSDTTSNAPTSTTQVASTYEGGRYGSYPSTSPASVPTAGDAQISNSYMAQTDAITPTPTTQPYRPGGTSDYPNQSAVEVATRPEHGATNSTPVVTPSSSKSQSNESYRY